MRENRRIRILIISGIFPPDPGGPATYVPIIADHLSRRGWRVSVLVTATSIGDGSSHYPFRLVRMRRCGNRLGRYFRYALRIVRELRNVDVVYANGLFPAVWIANMFVKRPIVCKIVGDWAWERAFNDGITALDIIPFQNETKCWRTEFLKRLRTRFLNLYDAIIVPSKFLHGLVQHWNLPKTIAISQIYNSVDPEPLPSEEIPPKIENQLVTVARLAPWKGVDQAIIAMASLSGYVLKVVGDGPDRIRLQNLAKQLNLGSRIEFAGSLQRKETLKIVAQSKALILNSSYEGLPHVILEAAALGTPVVGRASCGTPECVVDGVTGILIEAGTPSEIAEAIKKISAGNIRGTAKDILPDFFDQQGMLAKTEDVLRSVIQDA